MARYLDGWHVARLWRISCGLLAALVELGVQRWAAFPLRRVYSRIVAASAWCFLAVVLQCHMLRAERASQSALNQ